MNVPISPAKICLAALLCCGSLNGQTAPATPPASPAPAATAKTDGLASRQSKVKGLLVKEIAPGDFVGMASQMNATAVRNDDATAAFKVKFNQEVGEMMETALHEVEKFLSVRHSDLPKGWNVEISFEDKFVPKDGPSAAVACALMLDSLITGYQLDQNFACTGDMNADGAVQPVGGVPAKIEGAVKRKCTVIGIPVKCIQQVEDHMISEGIRSIASIQIFPITTFDEAKKLAGTERSPQFATSAANFAMVSKALLAQKDPLPTLRNPKVIEKLRAVLKDTPDCLSTKLLLAKALGKENKALSVIGSLVAVERGGGSILNGLREAGSSTDTRDSLKADTLGTSISTLTKLRPQLDKRIVPYCDSLLAYGKIWRRHLVEDPVQARGTAIRALGEIKTAAERVGTEYDKLRSDKSLQQAFMDE